MNKIFKKLEIQDILNFKKMIIKGEYYKNKDYVKNVELAVFHWVHDFYRNKNEELKQLNMKNLMDNLIDIEIFQCKTEIFKGIKNDFKFDGKYKKSLTSYSSNYEQAIMFSSFVDKCGCPNNLKKDDKSPFISLIRLKNVISFALDELSNIILENTVDKEIEDTLSSYISEEEKIYFFGKSNVEKIHLNDIYKIKILDYELWERSLIKDYLESIS